MCKDQMTYQDKIAESIRIITSAVPQAGWDLIDSSCDSERATTAYAVYEDVIKRIEDSLPLKPKRIRVVYFSAHERLRIQFYFPKTDLDV